MIQKRIDKRKNTKTETELSDKSVYHWYNTKVCGTLCLFSC